MALLTYAAHMLHLINDITYENQPAKEPLKVLMYALNSLLNKDRTPDLIIRVYALKMVQLMGFEPHVLGSHLC